MSDTLIGIDEVGARVGLSPNRIRRLRTNAMIAKYGHHPLFSLGFKTGAGASARLQWRESDVDEFLAERRDDAMRRAS